VDGTSGAGGGQVGQASASLGSSDWQAGQRVPASSKVGWLRFWALRARSNVRTSCKEAGF